MASLAFLCEYEGPEMCPSLTTFLNEFREEEVTLFGAVTSPFLMTSAEAEKKEDDRKRKEREAEERSTAPKPPTSTEEATKLQEVDESKELTCTTEVVSVPKSKPTPSPRSVPLPADSSRVAAASKNKTAARPPSPSYAASQRRLGGASSLPPSRPGSAPINRIPDALPQMQLGSSSYVERWMKNLYARQNSHERHEKENQLKRQQSAGGNERVSSTSMQSTGRAATDIFEDRTNTLSGKTSNVPIGAYRAPRSGSASRFRRDIASPGVVGPADVPAPQSGYVLPGRRNPRHQQVLHDARSHTPCV